MVTRSSSARFTPNGSVRERLGLPESRSTPYLRSLLESSRESHAGTAPGEWALYLAWELTRRMEGGSSEEKEAFETLVVATFAALEEGSTRLSLTSLSERFERLGAPEGLARVARALLEGGGPCSSLVGNPGDYKPLILDGDFLYPQRLHHRECRLAESWKRRLVSEPARSELPAILDALDGVLAHCPVVRGRPVRLLAEQQQAIRSALTRGTSLVTGGPGSGKTYIVASILRVLARMRKKNPLLDDVALAAPTARGAKRMEESIREALESVPEPDVIDSRLLSALPEARTLHRLLERPLYHRFVVVDEASMIDLELMDRLLRALPEEARLVLLGDADQLPAVETGGVFRDLLRSADDAIRLKESHRMDPKDPAGRNVLAVSRHVNEGNVERLFTSRVSGDSDGAGAEPWDVIAVRGSASDLRFEGVELFDGELDEFLGRWNREWAVAEEENRDEEKWSLPLDETSRAELRTFHESCHLRRILAATRHDVDRINRQCERERSRKPVIVLRNDYERSLVNGDLGVEANGFLFFPFRDDFLVFRAAGASNVALAYATTVHKSQGAEMDHVALVLPPADHPLCFRELLYTALTRARKSVTLVGSQEAVAAAASRTSPLSTGLGERLQKA